ncbi:MAG: ABC transporter permease subunit [Actinomycetota bacterium]|nr:ABC transporter permease subunit [Actinomycetota bacterium]
MTTRQTVSAPAGRPTGASAGRAGALPAMVRSLAWVMASLVVVVALFEGAKWAFGVSDITMPHSWSIVAAFGAETPSGQVRWMALAESVSVTLQQSLVGVLLGLLVGTLLGIVTAKSEFTSRTLTPVLVASQTLPLVAIVPALVILLGEGWFARAVIAAMLAFFPVYVAVARSITDIPIDQRKLFESLGFSRGRTFLSLELPQVTLAAVATVRTATALAVTGSIVAELPSGTSDGIAATMLTAASYYLTDPEALWCSALVAMAGGVLLVFVLSALASITARLALRTPPETRNVR